MISDSTKHNGCLTFLFDFFYEIKVLKLDFLWVEGQLYLFIFVAYPHSRVKFIPGGRNIDALTNDLAVLYHEEGSLQAVYSDSNVITHLQLLWRCYPAHLNWLVFYFTLVQEKVAAIVAE